MISRLRLLLEPIGVKMVGHCYRTGDDSWAGPLDQIRIDSINSSRSHGGHDRPGWMMVQQNVGIRVGAPRPDDHVGAMRKYPLFREHRGCGFQFRGDALPACQRDDFMDIAPAAE